MNILLVEDDAEVGNYISTQLRTAGHECVHILDGEDGLRDGEVIVLQPREYKLLEYLMRHPGQVVTRAMLLRGRR